MLTIPRPWQKNMSSHAWGRMSFSLFNKEEPMALSAHESSPCSFSASSFFGMTYLLSRFWFMDTLYCLHCGLTVFVGVCIITWVVLEFWELWVLWLGLSLFSVTTKNGMNPLTAAWGNKTRGGRTLRSGLLLVWAPNYFQVTLEQDKINIKAAVLSSVQEVWETFWNRPFWCLNIRLHFFCFSTYGWVLRHTQTALVLCLCPVCTISVASVLIHSYLLLRS